MGSGPEFGEFGVRPGPTQNSRLYASAAAAEEVDDREQDDRAQERDKQRADAEVALVDRAGVEERRQQQPAEECADDADDDVEDDALLVVRLHDDAGEPSEDAADDDPQYECHTRSELARERRAAIRPGRVGARNSCAVAVTQRRGSLARYLRSVYLVQAPRDFSTGYLSAFFSSFASMAAARSMPATSASSMR